MSYPQEFYFKELGGEANANALKAATLRYGSRFFAFNSNGWAKTWDKVEPKDFVKANATLYVRVTFPGWVHHPNQDVPGNDLGNVGVNTVPGIIQKINERENPFDAEAFNNNGWIKSRLGEVVEYHVGFLPAYYVRGDEAEEAGKSRKLY
ncbi:hypothetical protein BS47DRAFT_1361209 [Hydnum rufescens UP504]|uniref:Uncharacterized protein n=1 Tax=Hydnum rufescens UP504 TaxID=1448309 RepID=A0A9P6B0A7_9AGAM|nr:hypothetical protein BS47DRAFT_1361209 [Hydnum rufescens UP504]